MYNQRLPQFGFRFFPPFPSRVRRPYSYYGISKMNNIPQHSAVKDGNIHCTNNVNSSKNYGVHTANSSDTGQTRVDFKSSESNSERSCLADSDLYNENDVFEFFGFKFHFDDILLVCIFLFLFFEEKSDDYFLFFSLIWIFFCS